MNFVILNILSLKYQRFKPLDCKDIMKTNFRFVAKIQFLDTLCLLLYWNVFYLLFVLFYLIKLFAHIYLYEYMLVITGQTTGPNGQTFF